MVPQRLLEMLRCYWRLYKPQGWLFPGGTVAGRVLPIGGVKEKVLAAHRAGIVRVVLPAENRKDLVDIPPDVRKKLKFTFVDQIEKALQAVLEPAGRSSGSKKK